LSGSGGRLLVFAMDVRYLLFKLAAGVCEMAPSVACPIGLRNGDWYRRFSRASTLLGRLLGY
jgi:hypothetical protein